MYSREIIRTLGSACSEEFSCSPTLNILIKFDIMADIVVKSISFDDTNKC
jgi:hypothetical protein